ncbi:MAG TPA: hypothetical protein VI136_04720 [Verrucomicrobiae bacterium]
MKTLLAIIALTFEIGVCLGAPAKDATEAHQALEKLAPAALGFDGLGLNAVPGAIAERWSGKTLEDLRSFEALLEGRRGELVFDCAKKKDRDQVRLGALYSVDQVLFLTLVFWHDGEASIRQTLVMLEAVPVPKKKEPNQ